MALDDDFHLYFVDTNVTDNTITRWTVTGPGAINLDLTRPLIPSFQPVDDRPNRTEKAHCEPDDDRRDRADREPDPDSDQANGRVAPELTALEHATGRGKDIGGRWEEAGVDAVGTGSELPEGQQDDRR